MDGKTVLWDNLNSPKMQAPYQTAGKNVHMVQTKICPFNFCCVKGVVIGKRAIYHQQTRNEIPPYYGQ